MMTILDSARKTVETLHKANNALDLSESEREGTSQLLDNCSNQVDAYTHSGSFLHARTGRTKQLITDTLTFKNGLYMLSLTSSTVEDSTTVRTITVETLIYLPSTFMAVDLVPQLLVEG